MRLHITVNISMEVSYMGYYLLSFNCLSRRKGHSVIERAAYIGGCKLSYENITYDYSYRTDVIYSEIMLPADAPKDYSNNEILWSVVEHTERRRDSRLAREVMLALPRCLTTDSNIAIVKEFISINCIENKMCADFSIHSGNNMDSIYPEKEHTDSFLHNPHAHILLTTRQVMRDGFLSVKCRDWDKKEYLQQCRKSWAEIQNSAFVYKGLNVRVSHESYKARGIDREPTIHLGTTIMDLEKRGIKTSLGDKNRAIEARNCNRKRQISFKLSQCND